MQSPQTSVPDLPLSVEQDRVRTADLNVVEYGAYRLLVNEYWLNQGPLAEDDDRFSKITRTNPEGIYADSWAVIKQRIAKLFVVIGGVWRLPHLDSIIAESLAERERRSKTAMQVNEKRWVVNPADLKLEIPTETAAEQEFERFWQEYPRKDAKQRAWLAYRRALRAEKPEVILKAVIAAKSSEDWTRENGKFIPHGATWLNGQRWIEYRVSLNKPVEPIKPKGPVFEIAGLYFTAENGPKRQQFKDDTTFLAACDAWELWAQRQ